MNVFGNCKWALKKIIIFFVLLAIVTETAVSLPISGFSNNLPVIEVICPENGQDEISPWGTIVSVKIIDTDDDKIKPEIWSNHTGIWLKYAGWDISKDPQTKFILDQDGDGWDTDDINSYNQSNGWMEGGTFGFVDITTYEDLPVTRYWNMTNSGTKYFWSVNVTDGKGWKNTTFYFTTEIMVYYVNSKYDKKTVNWGITHFNTIGDCIKKSRPNSTILVYTGLYEENVIVDKPLKIYGENTETTYIVGKKEIRRILIVKILL